jgi:cephalosporin hydroxylase
MNLEEIKGLIRIRDFSAALKKMDALVAGGPNEREIADLRLDCLMGIGQFEKAFAMTGELLQKDPTHNNASELRAHLQPAIDGPPRCQASPGLRSFNSELPHAVLSRIQWAVICGYQYRGIQMVKDPFDMALYPMLIWNLRPATIIEIGSKTGGSALWFGDMLKNFDISGHIYSIDLLPPDGISQDNVTFLAGNGRALDQTLTLELLAGFDRPWLVIEDADHAYETTIAVLVYLHPFLKAGDYIVIEDGIISDLHPESYPEYSSGPHRALREFIPRHESDYLIDPQYCDFFGYNATWNSNGYLKRVR